MIRKRIVYRKHFKQAKARLHIVKWFQVLLSKTNRLFWFGLILWPINPCRLFNAESSLYIYIKYIGFDLVGFMAYQTL